MRTTTRSLSGLLGVLALASLLMACDSGSSSTSGGSSGGSDWEARFAKGDGEAVKILASKGTAAVPTLSKLLQNENQTVVQMAAMCLKKLGPDGKGAVSELVGALERFPDQPFVVQAIKTQALMDAAIPVIVGYLKTGSPTMQAQAAKLLNGTKADREAAIEPLLQIIQGSAPDATKIEAMGAIASIGVAADARARPVLEVIQSQGGELGTYAQRSIKRLDSAQKMAEIRREEAGQR